LDLEKTVYYYGSRQDIDNILEQASIGVLSSDSEGLPLALLEYGMHKKPVVMTAVGEMPSIVKHGKNGFIIASQKEELFYTALVELIEDEGLRKDFAEGLYRSIKNDFSQSSVIKKYINWMQNSLK